MKRRFSISNVKLNIFAIHSSHSICLRHSIQFQICVRISFIWTLWSTIPIICTSGSRNDYNIFYFNVSIFLSHTGQTNIYIDVWIIKFVQSCIFLLDIAAAILWPIILHFKCFEFDQNNLNMRLIDKVEKLCK